MHTSFIRRHISSLPKDQPFTTRELLIHGSRAVVDQTLCRLVKSGLILRLARGVFIREGSKIPSAFEVARIKAQAFGKEIAIHCADLARAMGLIAQGNRQLVVSVNGRSSSFRFGSIIIRMQSASLRKMLLKKSNVGQAITALWHLGKAGLTQAHIMMATKSFNRLDREELCRSVVWMPAWLGNVFVSRRYIGPRPPVYNAALSIPGRTDN